MVQRVNFLQKGKYALTYQNMAIAFGLWLIVCLCIHGVVVVQHGWKKAKLLSAKEGVKALTAEFEKQAQLAQASKKVERTGTAIQSLAGVFQNFPLWSRALSQLAESVPGQVSLTTLKTTGGTVAGANAATNGGRHIEVEGRGKSAEAITFFVQKMDELPIFENVILAKSTKDMELQDLLFTISADVNFQGL